MPSEKEMSSVIGILKKHRNEFVTPALTEIAERSRRDRSGSQSASGSPDPFKVLVSCILSLRTRDETTAKVSERLYAVADNPYSMSKLPARQIASAIKSVNYYKTKARVIKGICKKLVKEYGGKVPDDIQSLLSFKGVGRKTANIVMVYGFEKHGIPVDTHVHRVSNRLGWAGTKTPEKTEDALRALLPKKYWLDLNDLFVQFGQNVCTPRNPKCGSCPISRHCRYYKETYSKETLSAAASTSIDGNGA